VYASFLRNSIAKSEKDTIIYDVPPLEEVKGVFPSLPFPTPPPTPTLPCSGNGSVKTTLLRSDLKESSIFTPCSEHISNTTNFTLGIEFTAFLITSELRLLLPDPVKAKTPT
jgi:hypothetical protein